SFETPNIGATFFVTFPAGGGFSAWQVVGSSGNIAIINVTGNASYVPEDGNQFIDLTGTTNTFGIGMQQVVSTVAGHSYQISFYVGNALRDGSLTSTVDVSINGAAALAFTNSSSDPLNANNIVWQQFTTTFVATSSSTQIAFRNGDNGGDSLNGL